MATPTKLTQERQVRQPLDLVEDDPLQQPLITRQPLISKLAFWLGLTAGSVLVYAGARIIPGPGFIPAAASWGLFVTLAIGAIELLRRHHRPLRRHGRRLSSQAATAAGSLSRQGAKSARRRWNEWRHPPVDGALPPVSAVQVTAPKPAPASPPPAQSTGGTAMAQPTRPQPAGRPKVPQQPGVRARRTAGASPVPVPVEWGVLLTRIMQFTPDEDTDLMLFLTEEIAGMAGYGEGWVSLHEQLTEGTGLDPAALQLFHDIADAIVICVSTVAAAKKAYLDHHELVDEYAADGGLLAYDGRFHTGDVNV